MESSPTPQSFPRSFTFRLRDCADSASAHCAGRLAPGEYPSTFFPGKRRGQLPKEVRLTLLPFQAQERWAERPTPQALPTITSVPDPAPISPPYPCHHHVPPIAAAPGQDRSALCAERASRNRVIGSLSHRVIERLSDCVIENRKESLHARNPQPVPGAKPAPALPTGKGPGGRGGHSIACWPDHSVAQLPQSPEAGAL